MKTTSKTVSCEALGHDCNVTFYYKKIELAGNTNIHCPDTYKCECQSNLDIDKNKCNCLKEFRKLENISA